ncbi:MAG: UDP-N-acetylmuramoyl-L-alanine--D-glutamate ligase [Alphaproteobacteria bacterium]|nr:UDP-N-acetylmuramoyl-L-alanine--D-glutamate ligase [Alphaproteobacteria bacterium]
MPEQQTSFTAFFKGKTVTQLGLGLLGRGVGDAAFLARHCKKLFITDLKSADELRPSLDALKEFPNIEFHLGKHDNALFENADFILKGAGVRLDNPQIAHARERGIPVYMSTALFAHLAGIKIIGITGTRGKTTTACMIDGVLKHAGKKTLLGGNIRGVSTLALLPEAARYEYAVLELDSWQLQGFDGLGISPNISVFTNFYPDHMNYYDGDMARYLRDKTAIFRHQKTGDTLVTTEDVTALTQNARAECGYKGRWIVVPPLPADFSLQIPGAHNLANAALAKAACIACGIDAATIDEALRAFTAVEGRLQYAGEAQGRKFYNDSNATTQEATLAALASFPPASTVLIFGGADKGLPIGRLVSFIDEHKIRCVLIKGTGSDRVLEKLPDLPAVATMQDAVAAAMKASHEGDAIILSPSFASFGAFKNEYDRSDQFMREVRNLTGK